MVYDTAPVVLMWRFNYSHMFSITLCYVHYADGVNVQIYIVVALAMCAGAPSWSNRIPLLFLNMGNISVWSTSFWYRTAFILPFMNTMLVLWCKDTHIFTDPPPYYLLDDAVVVEPCSPFSIYPWKTVVFLSAESLFMMKYHHFVTLTITHHHVYWSLCVKFVFVMR